LPTPVEEQRIVAHIKRTVPLDLPPDVANAFLADMREFFAAPTNVRRDQLAARQLGICAST
jgi:hypothetical protein